MRALIRVDMAQDNHACRSSRDSYADPELEGVRDTSISKLIAGKVA